MSQFGEQLSASPRRCLFFERKCAREFGGHIRSRCRSWRCCAISCSDVGACSTCTIGGISRLGVIAPGPTDLVYEDRVAPRTGSTGQLSSKDHMAFDESSPMPSDANVSVAHPSLPPATQTSPGSGASPVHVLRRHLDLLRRRLLFRCSQVA